MASDEIDELRQQISELSEAEKIALFPELTSVDEERMRRLKRDVGELSTTEQTDLQVHLLGELVAEFAADGETISEYVDLNAMGDEIPPLFKHGKPGSDVPTWETPTGTGGGGGFDPGHLAHCRVLCLPALIYGPWWYGLCVVGCMAGHEWL